VTLVHQDDPRQSLIASVIVPTYNRSYFLVRVLDGLAAQKVNGVMFEIIVVDNNSNDDTPSVCKDFVRVHPEMHFRYLIESRQGLSHARNRGIMEASGEIVCFLDDDAAPTPGWLESLLGGFAEPTVACVGGPAIPDYLGQERPPWLKGDLQGLIGGYWLPYATPTTVSARYGSPIGGNMAFRKRVFEQVGQFRVDLDPTAGARILGGESEMISRLGGAGWQVLYVPDAVVMHFVLPKKLAKSYLYEEGMRLAASHIISTLDSRPRQVVRWFASDLWFAARLFFRYVAARLIRKESWFDDYMRFWIIAQRLVIRLEALTHKRYTRAGILAQVSEMQT
jgi:glycosyltransferase involved in cell wall biosynthesis